MTHIIIGITGGIACYKMAHVVSRLIQSDCQVTVAMTDAAARFVSPLTFQSLSGRPILTSIWESADPGDPQHIRLARSAQAMLIAPATMNIIARLVHGFADDVVSLIASAINRSTTPVLIAPSMNATMLAQPATQRNLAQLEDDGYTVIAPDSGWQACRTEGPGRLPEPDALVEAVLEAIA
ncbi:MAG: flavoprotein [Phycisphaerales bacterium]